MSLKPDEPMESIVKQTSCERCRKRKIGCDRRSPCSKCKKAKVECVFIGSGEKQRPVSRGYVQALEGQIASLEKFITKLIAVDNSKRDEMLTNFKASSKHMRTPPEPPERESGGDKTESLLPIRSRAGHLRKLRDGKAAEFYGATSFFQINPSDIQDHTPTPPQVSRVQASSTMVQATETGITSTQDLEPDTLLAFSPRSDMSRHLMATFFKTQYVYYMCLYREYFLRDFDANGGPYYSDLLMYSICAIAALASEELSLRDLSDVYFSKAQELLYGSALESPNLTTLQALILLGHREIGQGRTSKGWLFSGMAFRLAHEMGLHLDPSNWNGSDDSRVDREILRRTYWAAFIADTELSLYFGRLPALFYTLSDVRDTERIPYPPEWELLLNTYIQEGTSETAFEDGFALVAAFFHRVELCKIIHRMITEVFENRNVNADETVLSTSVEEIHVSLTKWLSNLPAKLHWNQWVFGSVPSLVLHLHMLYHTAMIILHRPPRQSLRDPNITTSKDIEICYASLDSNIKLLRTYSRQYSYRNLPFSFVHILASTASAILMKQHLQSSAKLQASTSPEVSEDTCTRPLETVLDALAAISQTWLCAKQVQDVITASMQASSPASARDKSPESFDFMAGFSETAYYNPMDLEGGYGMEEDNIGYFDPGEFLGFDDGFQWDGDSNLFIDSSLPFD